MHGPAGRAGLLRRRARHRSGDNDRGSGEGVRPQLSVPLPAVPTPSAGVGRGSVRPARPRRQCWPLPRHAELRRSATPRRQAWSRCCRTYAVRERSVRRRAGGAGCRYSGAGDVRGSAAWSRPMSSAMREGLVGCCAGSSCSSSGSSPRNRTPPPLHRSGSPRTPLPQPQEAASGPAGNVSELSRHGFAGPIAGLVCGPPARNSSRNIYSLLRRLRVNLATDSPGPRPPLPRPAGRTARRGPGR